MKNKIKHLPTCNYHDSWNRTPWIIVLHYTAGYSEPQTWNTLRTSGLSVHKAIERNGDIFEYVPDSGRAFHAGQSSWGGKSYLNNHSLGIEVVNFGHVDGLYNGLSPFKVFRNEDPNTSEVNVGDSEFYRDEKYKTKKGVTKTVRVLTRQPSARFVDHRTEFDGKLWASYSYKQIDSIVDTLFLWVKKYDILMSNIVGHEHIAPGRKSDPGPAFPWKLINLKLGEKLKEINHRTLDPKLYKIYKIKSIQSQCSRLKLKVGDIDGIWGNKTSNAIESAYKLYGQIYDLKSYKIVKENSMQIACELKSIPGF